jgi:hypothetical protein
MGREKTSEPECRFEDAKENMRADPGFSDRRFPGRIGRERSRPKSTVEIGIER